MTQAAPIAVVPQQVFPGLDHIDGQAPTIEVAPFEETFARAWETDAHFVGYLTEPYDPKEPFYRLNISTLPEIARAGGHVVLNYAAVEWDTPGHEPWGQESFSAFAAILESLEASQGQPSDSPPLPTLLRSACAHYTTRRGARWVFRLDPPVFVETGEADAVIRGLIATFRDGGLAVDPRAVGWSRLFRLPCVLRDGVRSEADPFFLCEIYPERTLASVGLPRPRVALLADREDVGPRPAPDVARALIEGADAKGRPRLTDLGKRAKEQLIGRDYYPALFEQAHLGFEAGERHDTVMSWVASAASLLAPLGDFSAEALYGLFLPVVDRLIDGEGRDWHGEVWKEVAWAWGRETSAQAATAEVAAASASEAIDKLLDGVRGWFPGLSMDREVAWGWVSRHLIVSVATGLFVMMPTGRYAKLGVSERQLLAQIRHQGLDVFISTRVALKNGGMRVLTPGEILEAHGIPAARLEARAEIDGGFLVDLDRENPTLVVPSFRRRRDLVPEFNADCDLFLRAFAGEKYETFCRHIGCFLAWDRGAVPMMSVVLPASSGKKMIARAFLECMEEPWTATGRDLVDSFNDGILRSPFLQVNEGLPLARGYNHAADMVRALVTGDDVPVNRKHLPVVLIRNPMRIMFFANNHNIIMGICEGRDLAPDDREAIGQRLIHYEAGRAAADLLARKGGMEWTEGWIAGDSGQSSRFVLAKHFLWLWEKYGKDAQPTATHGLLLAGEGMHSDIVRMMQVQGGAAPIVVEAIIGVLNQQMPLKSDRVVIRDGHLYITVSAILDYWRANLSSSSADRLTARRVANALRGLVVGTTAWINGHHERWHQVDPMILKEEAEKHGWGCRRLDEILSMNGNRNKILHRDENVQNVSGT